MTPLSHFISQLSTVNFRSNKRRRRLASITIVFGYIFSLIIVSVAVNTFLHLTSSEMNTFIGIGITLSIVFIIIFIMVKSRKAKIYFDAFINRVYEKMSRKKHNHVIIMDVIGKEIMASVHLTFLPDILEDVELQASGIKENYGIQILIVSRSGQRLEPVNGGTKLLQDDHVIAFGRENEIYRLFEKEEKR